jgi:hypothetical protein
MKIKEKEKEKEKKIFQSGRNQSNPHRHPAHSPVPTKQLVSELPPPFKEKKKRKKEKRTPLPQCTHRIITTNKHTPP